MHLLKGVISGLQHRDLQVRVLPGVQCECNSAVECQTENLVVIGSNPITRTMVSYRSGLTALPAKQMLTGSNPVPTSFLLCNGSTSDFGSEDLGSNPCGKTK